MLNQTQSNGALTKIVALGIATGAIIWIPLAWLDWGPPVVTGASDVASHKRSSSKIAGASTSDGSKGPLTPLLAGGGLPIGPLERIGDSGRPAAVADAAEELPESDEKSSQAKPKQSKSAHSKAPKTIVRVAAEGTLPPATSEVPTLELRQPEPVSVAIFDEPTPTAAEDERETIELMHELNDADASLAQAAERKLIERGFRPEHVELARQLTSANVHERAAVAARLPSVAGIDARLWLTWMLRDESTDVRLAAISVLATTGDPDTLRRVLEIARQDRDPRIRQHLEQIEKMRRGGG